MDQIVPVKHHEPFTLYNLARACFQCNMTKGSDVAVHDLETGNQQWDDHFEMNGAIIVGKTPTGRVTILVLAMNHQSQVETRQLLIALGEW